MASVEARYGLQRDPPSVEARLRELDWSEGIAKGTIVDADRGREWARSRQAEIYRLRQPELWGALTLTCQASGWVAQGSDAVTGNQAAASFAEALALRADPDAPEPQ